MSLAYGFPINPRGDPHFAEATVKTHITAIMSKINARRRTQAVLWALSNA